MKKALVLFSGGQDSTTCLMWAIRETGSPKNVIALAFNYGQKHAQELTQAVKIADRFGVKMYIKDVRGLTASSALTDSSIDVNAIHQKSLLPATFTPGRNALFLTIAASFAYELGITDIVTGVCETDYSGYPDCRAEFITSQMLTLRLALGIEDLHISAPLMYLTKAQTWKLAREMNSEIIQLCRMGSKASSPDFLQPFEIVRQLTMTDYNGDMTMNEWGMGKEDNPASILRAKGFREAKAAFWL